MADPVGRGSVQSLARPGGNITGFSSNDAELMGKWLQLLKEVAPPLERFAFPARNRLLAAANLPMISLGAP